MTDLMWAHASPLGVPGVPGSRPTWECACKVGSDYYVGLISCKINPALGAVEYSDMYLVVLVICKHYLIMFGQYFETYFVIWVGVFTQSGD